MNNFQNWLNRLRTGDRQGSDFENWPLSPTIKQVPVGQVGELEFSNQLSGVCQTPDKYDPAVVIGLGNTGDRVLRNWLNQISQDPAGPQKKLHAILITTKPVSDLRTDCLASIRQCDLTTGSGIVQIPLTEGLTSRREEIHQLFRQTSNIGLFQRYLGICLGDLHQDVRVVLIGSVAEVEIGILGDVLQVLRLHQQRTQRENLFLSVTAFVTMASPKPGLEDCEIFSALREIGRLTFSGLHWMEPIKGARSGVVDRALLDNLFLFDTRPFSQLPGQRHVSFEHGIGQSMSEALFTLLHPAAAPIWEHMANDLRLSGQAREQDHDAVLNTLNIATLYVPIAEMRAYVAARLAFAGVYGEHPNRPAEGLLASGESTISSSSKGQLIVRRWLGEGPCSPYLFDWLLAANGATYFSQIPHLTEEYRDVFQAQLAHGLTSLLNDQSEKGQLILAREALLWLVSFLEMVDGWFKAAPVKNRSDPERLSFQYLLNHWRNGVQGLSSQLEEWIKVLLPPDKTSIATESWSKPSTLESSLEVNWRKAAIKTGKSNWRTPAEPFKAASTAPTRLFDYLQQAIQRNESALEVAAGGQFCRAVTADGEDRLKEAIAYYVDTIRPELSRFGIENSRAFNRVRNRLKWWVNLTPGQEAKLYLLCIFPLNKATTIGDVFPMEFCFAPQEIEPLGRTLLDLAATQAQGDADDLTGPWFQRRLEDMLKFMGNVKDPLLAYDLDSATSRSYPPVRRAYLIGKDKTLTKRYKMPIFPDLAPSDINDLGNGENTRLTALGLWLNIPLNSVFLARQAHDHYLYQEQFHLYPQERTATLYEQRIHALTGEWQMLPPELTLALADPKLVTIFCQALFAGLISVHHDRHGQNPQWTMVLDEGFEPLPLAQADGKRGLWRALVHFSLELPNDLDVEQSPYKHFSNRNRREFLDTLLDKVRKGRRDPNAMSKRKEFEENYMACWKERSRIDVFDRSFYNLLMAELDEPMWKDW